MTSSSAHAPGIVYLVGAGPGDPGLITVRGAGLLATAEVVVYDYLSNPRLLSYCPADAQQIYVGKKAAQHSMTQDQINALLVEHGQAGKRVSVGDRAGFYSYNTHFSSLPPYCPHQILTTFFSSIRVAPAESLA